jgi:hypothetical protein
MKLTLLGGWGTFSVFFSLSTIKNLGSRKQDIKTLNAEKQTDWLGSQQPRKADTCRKKVQ